MKCKCGKEMKIDNHKRGKDVDVIKYKCPECGKTKDVPENK